MVLGLSLASAILQSTLRKELRISLEGMDGREQVCFIFILLCKLLMIELQIISKALADLEYVRSLHGKLGRLVTEAYVRCLTYTHGMYTYFLLETIMLEEC